MNKKMHFFRFCRRNLAALPVFLLFAACNHGDGFCLGAIFDLPEAPKN
jgi:hypothetical protein